MTRLSDDDRVLLAKSFSVSESTVNDMATRYEQDVSSNMKLQYLAHTIRALEAEIRKTTKTPTFQILCEGYKGACGMVSIAPDGSSAVIAYPDFLEPEQIRIIVAHELGHVFQKFFLEKNLSSQKSIEPLASIFGALAIFDKSEFYKNAKNQFSTNLVHIIEQFTLMRNRVRGKCGIGEMPH